MKSIFVALAIVIVCFMQSTYAIKCYQCRSWTESECSNDKYTDQSHIVDCDLATKPNTMEQYSPVTKCNKIITKDAVSQIVTRGCQFEVIGSKPGVCTVSGNREVLSCNVCTGDLCNGTSGAGRFITMGLAALLAFVAIHFTF